MRCDYARCSQLFREHGGLVAAADKDTNSFTWSLNKRGVFERRDPTAPRPVHPPNRSARRIGTSHAATSDDGRPPIVVSVLRWRPTKCVSTRPKRPDCVFAIVVRRALLSHAR